MGRESIVVGVNSLPFRRRDFGVLVVTCQRGSEGGNFATSAIDKVRGQSIRNFTEIIPSPAINERSEFW